jgi:hypothetical protein
VKLYLLAILFFCTTLHAVADSMGWSRPVEFGGAFLAGMLLVHSLNGFGSMLRQCGWSARSTTVVCVLAMYGVVMPWTLHKLDALTYASFALDVMCGWMAGASLIGLVWKLCLRDPLSEATA